MLRFSVLTRYLRYNLTNSDVPLTYNNTFVPGGPWLAPTSVLTARFVKLGAQIDF